MSYVALQNFKAGLDSRRSELSAIPGSLQLAQNGHIDQGGQFVKRSAFVNQGQLPAGCFGLQETSNGLMTFGSGTNPGGLPTGVTYQQLQHPAVVDGASFNSGKHAMTSVVCSCCMSGNPWVVASFNDGGTFVYYNGSYIAAFRNGQVLFGWNTNQNICTQVRNYINSLGLTGWSVGAVTSDGSGGYYFLLSAPQGQAFTMNSSKVSASGVITPTLISNGYQGVTPIAATSTFSFTAGTQGQVTEVAYSSDAGVTWHNLLSSSINYQNSNTAALALAVALNIATNATTNGIFTALASQNSVTIIDNTNGGSAINTYLLRVKTGLLSSFNDICVDNICFNFSGGWSTTNPDVVSNVLYNTTGSTLQEILATNHNFVPGGATYSAGGVYTLTIPKNIRYTWTKGANDTNIVGTTTLTSTGVVQDAGSGTLTLHGTNNAAVTATVVFSSVPFVSGDTSLTFAQRVAAFINGNYGSLSPAYVASVVAVTSPTNSANMFISRTIAASNDGASAATTGAELTYTSSSTGLISNGLSGSGQSTSSGMTVGVSPGNQNFTTAGTYTIQFAATVTGGVGSKTYNWTPNYTQGSYFNGSIVLQSMSGQGTAFLSVTLQVTLGRSGGPSFYPVLTVTDQVGNTANYY